jgi:hypothetical protein
MGKWETFEILRKEKGRKGNLKLTGDKNIAGSCSTEERASQMAMANEIPHRCLGSACFSPLSICFSVSGPPQCEGFFTQFCDVAKLAIIHKKI